jgi:hypothetical protein
LFFTHSTISKLEWYNNISFGGTEGVAITIIQGQPATTTILLEFLIVRNQNLTGELIVDLCWFCLELRQLATQSSGRKDTGDERLEGNDLSFP